MVKNLCDNCKHLDIDNVVFTVKGHVFYICRKHKRYTKLNWTLFCWKDKNECA